MFNPLSSICKSKYWYFSWKLEWHLWIYLPSFKLLIQSPGGIWTITMLQSCLTVWSQKYFVGLWIRVHRTQYRTNIWYWVPPRTFSSQRRSSKDSLTEWVCESCANVCLTVVKQMFVFELCFQWRCWCVTRFHTVPHLQCRDHRSPNMCRHYQNSRNEFKQRSGTAQRVQNKGYLTTEGGEELEVKPQDQVFLYISLSIWVRYREKLWTRGWNKS